MTEGSDQHSSEPYQIFVIEFALLIAIGVLVALAMVPLVDRDTFRNIDRYALDALMRSYTKQKLSNPEPGSPRFVYVDISESDCELWAKNEASSCAFGWSPGREHLTNIINTISSRIYDRNGSPTTDHSLPKIVLIDVNLTPRGRDDPADAALCKGLLSLARHVPVVLAASLSFDPDTSGIQVTSYPSILERPHETAPACQELKATQRAHIDNIWLGSPLLEPDTDGIVRSVQAWTKVNDRAEEQYTRIAGMSVIAAALLQPQIDKKALACLFPRSALVRTRDDTACAQSSISMQFVNFSPRDDKEVELITPIFTLPYQRHGRGEGQLTANSPSKILVVDANELQKNIDLLSEAIVVIGGSWQSSGDLHTTPLGQNMPGAMIHANALRALLTGEMLEEDNSLSLEITLVFLAAFVGAAVHTLGSLLPKLLSSPFAQIAQMGAALVGVVISVAVVLATAVGWASEELSLTGTALGTITPALAVAFEGLSGVINDVKGHLHGWLAKALEKSSSSSSG